MGCASQFRAEEAANQAFAAPVGPPRSLDVRSVGRRRYGEPRAREETRQEAEAREVDRAAGESVIASAPSGRFSHVPDGNNGGVCGTARRGDAAGSRIDFDRRHGPGDATDATVATDAWTDGGSRRSLRPRDRNSGSAAAAAAKRHDALAAALPDVKTRALTEAPKKSSVQNATNRTAAPPKRTPPALVAATENGPIAKESMTEPAVPEPMPAAPSSGSGASLSSVTITGCLEISTDGNEFRLADTDGPDAPKSRSWRTGFLRKRTAPVALVGAPDPLALKKSVGKRVAATGLLTGRELLVGSLRVVGPFCN